MEVGKFDALRRINQFGMRVCPGREMLNSTPEVDNFYPYRLSNPSWRIPRRKPCKVTCDGEIGSTLVIACMTVGYNRYLFMKQPHTYVMGDSVKSNSEINERYLA